MAWLTEPLEIRRSRGVIMNMELKNADKMKKSSTMSLLMLRNSSTVQLQGTAFEEY